MKEFSILSLKPNTITVKTSILGLHGKSVEKRKTDITGQFRLPPPFGATNFFVQRAVGPVMCAAIFPAVWDILDVK